VPLDRQLADLLRTCRGQAARVVDGWRGVVLAKVGSAHGDDVAALVNLARAAAAVGRGEPVVDLVVTAERAVHVLREYGDVVLHVRLDPAVGDVAAARRGLAAPALVHAAHGAVGIHAAVGRAPVDPVVPVPRRPADPGTQGHTQGQEPALASIMGVGPPIHAGSLAARALPQVVPLPRRTPAPPPSTRPGRAGPAPAVLRRAWADDLGTMGRLLAALHRMS
jgi:hypothetical protein